VGSNRPTAGRTAAAPQCESDLKAGVSLASLEEFAQQQTDTEAAIAMQ
jgi:hypothetical protein